MKDIAKMLRRHQELILNWFRAKKHFNNGIVEGLNLKWNLTVRKAFGFRTFNALQMASFHQLGDLPEPQLTHEFYVAARAKDIFQIHDRTGLALLEAPTPLTYSAVSAERWS